ncbi:NAD(P)/FAD-dependent oxidoreductase [Allostreptomyces psammosilenae]|uniref:Glycine/D-amino acid oxidase-like deaminating enzyme n=1 Tax=Allostreptomyces psammosilenae TaxID=1892865 RepID=A0A852ZPM9_9ACTN|nr:FAD-dependent oxidoreductase [Allostreptomyces psammosilenae]NYI04343.1 glycine/D-amino acid oxidase-like deaminating enzyme [Allostreptomyces psammosilenae]
MTADVAVVGAGVVGASVAYHLARQGAAVTLVDRAASPAAGVTGASFAWIGECGGDWPGGAEDLRGSVLADYGRLEAEVPGVAVRRTGSLAWTSTSVRLGEDAAGPGPGQHWVGRAEIAALEPNLRTPPERAVYTPTDAGVDPVRLTEALVRAAQALGARVVLDSAVTSLRVVGGRVTGVVTATGFRPASTVVLAAGTDVVALCEPLGLSVPVAASPALLIRAATPPGLVKTILAGPEFEAREVRDGQVLMAAHLDGRSDAALARFAEHAVERLRSAFHDAGPVQLLGHRVGRRPVPAGGPIIGHLTPDRSVYLAVTHSAVTLAPTVGRLVARELVTGEPADELSRCRPSGVHGR